MGIDFFLVGGPKSGTTSIHQYFMHHPEVFVPQCKEPNFYASDLPNIRGRISNHSDYKKLFDHKQKSKFIMGECSPTYLMSDAAHAEIYNDHPEAKIIAILRNPVDLFFSEHSQLLFSMYEDITDPLKAWKTQGKREHISEKQFFYKELKLLDYKKTCSHYHNVKKYLELFGEEKVLILLFDDIKSHDKFLKRICEFLKIEYLTNIPFESINKRKTHNNNFLIRLLIHPRNKFLSKLHSWARTLIATSNIQLIRQLDTIARYLISKLSKEEKIKISSNSWFKVYDDLKDEIESVENLLGRKLPNWHLPPCQRNNHTS